MKILITGGFGFIGSNLIKSLFKNFDLYVIDNLYREGSIYNFIKLKNKVKYFKIDITDYSELERILKNVKPNYIFHLAGQVAMISSITNPLMDLKINAQGTLNLLTAVKNLGIDTKIVYSSTNKVYGDLEYLNYKEIATRYSLKDFPNGLNENLKLDFSTPYGISKGAADMYMRDFNKLFGIQTCVFRHSSMYGGFQHPTYEQGWVSWFISQIILNKEFTVSGSGKQVRDLLHASDVVNLFKCVISDFKPFEGEVFNIGGGVDNSMSIIELIKFFEIKEKRKIPFKSITQRKSDQKVFIADISKVKNCSNWQPIIDKEIGLEKTFEWLRTKI